MRDARPVETPIDVWRQAGLFMAMPAGRGALRSVRSAALPDQESWGAGAMPEQLLAEAHFSAMGGPF
jgi:hypothetical protein